MGGLGRKKGWCFWGGRGGGWYPNAHYGQQSKIIENPNSVGIKSIIIELRKTSHELSKTVKQAKKVSQIGGDDNPLYSETKKVKIFWMKKM